MNESVQNDLDRLNIDDEKVQSKIAVNSQFEVEVKKHYVQRILTNNRYSSEHLECVISQFVSVDRSKSIEQNLRERFAKLTINQLRNLIRKLQATQAEHSRVMSVFEFDQCWQIIVRPMGLSVLCETPKKVAQNMIHNEAVLRKSHAQDGHGLITLLKAQTRAHALMMDQAILNRSSKAESIMEQALLKVQD